MKITKYSEIPQFTRNGSYQVNMPFRDFQGWIDKMICEYGLQLSPDFQRGHVWTEQQQQKYVEYLLRGGKSSRVLYFNQPSWQGRRTTSYDDFVCVDGLQRITAILDFMDDKLIVFGSKKSEFTDRLSFDTDVIININNLKTRREVLQWYVEMNEGGTPHSGDEIDRVKAMIAEC